MAKEGEMKRYWVRFDNLLSEEDAEKDGHAGFPVCLVQDIKCELADIMRRMDDARNMVSAFRGTLDGK